MSRRTHPCVSCEGRTRHDNRVCAPCRRPKVTVTPEDALRVAMAPMLSKVTP